MAGRVSEHRSRSRVLAGSPGHLGWLLAAVGATGAVYFAYLLGHTHPAYEGGLFLNIVAEISAHGYGLPSTVPGYTERGVPFAYPPLVFYVLAAVVDLTGIDPTHLVLVLPGLLVMAYLVPYYYVARSLLDSERAAGVATVLFGVVPAALRWHLSAGGVVRSTALLFALCGTYAGIRLFREREGRWLVPATALFGLTVLTHPHYTAFFGVTYLLLFAAYDRTPRGLVRGAVVAAGGLALASPWWLQVLATHGADVFLAASGTHQGLAGGTERLWAMFGAPILALDPISPFYLALAAGLGYALLSGRYVLPAWAATAGYLIGKQRFVFVAGAMLIAILLWEVVVPGVRDLAGSRGARRTAPLAVAILLVLSATGVGALFAASELRTAHEHSHSMPQTVDDADRAAMAWAATNTAPSADFLVLGDTAEWFPVYGERATVVSPWGLEWTTADRYYAEVALLRRSATCEGAWCVTATMADADRDPEYVYVPRGTFTVRGKEHRADRDLLTSLERSETYRLAYQNAGVTVFRVRRDLPDTYRRNLAATGGRSATLTAS